MALLESMTRPVTVPVVTCAIAELDSRAKPMTIPAEMLQIFRFIVPLSFATWAVPSTLVPISALASKQDRLEPIVGVVYIEPYDLSTSR